MADDFSASASKAHQPQRQRSIQQDAKQQAHEKINSKRHVHARSDFSIADAFGEAWGALARKAAIVFAQRHRDEDIVVVLLHNIREIFDTRGVDRLSSRVLVDALCDMDDAGWSEWKLTQGKLARLLEPFGIRPRTIWPTQRRSDSKSSRGYLRSQFEQAWASYCSTADTPTQSS